MLVSSCEFLGSRCSERDTLLGGINEHLPFSPYIFLPIWKELVLTEFNECFVLVKIGAVKVILHLGA